MEASDEALSSDQPEIFNTDQGSQLTPREYTGRLVEDGIAVSRDGRGRQGQRTLKCCSGNNLQKEILGPATTSTFHGDAVAARVLLQE